MAAQARGQGRDVLALTSSDWDITDAPAAERFVEAGDVVINCAAYTKVDAAEADETRAHAVNAVGPANVAHACARAGAEFIHVSTDYVFSGSKRSPYEIDDETGPLGVYGRTKLAGEFAVLTAMPDAHIVRTAWIYEGGDGTDFAATMRRLAAGDGPVDVVADQVGSPTYVADLVDALLEVADGSIREPVLHAANDRRGQPLRAGASRVRGRGRRSGPRAPNRQRPPPEARTPAAVLGAVRPAVRRSRSDPAAALARRAGRSARRYDRPITLYAVSDELVVVTVTYSPGPHLNRFLAIAVACHRPCGDRHHGRQRIHRRHTRRGAGALSQCAAAAHRRKPRLRHAR